MPKRRLDIKDQKVILLFYKEYEADKFFKYDRYLKRLLRPLYHLFHRRQKKTGFAVSFELMRRCLVAAGYEVLVNDYATANDNPNYPVGLVGFPCLLENLRLKNPAVLGPSLYDHPMLAPHLFDDKRFKKYVVLAPWTKALYAPVYGDRCFEWFAGIDLQEWPDLSGEPKTYDFLIYDKIRWDHELYQTTLIDPIIQILEESNYTYRLVRYKMHDHAVFRQLLSGARSILFLCEHETQGIAYQEAMASNVPVLAWDRGYWADPLWKKYSDKAPIASSVPFFSPECGTTFTNLGDFGTSLERFMNDQPAYNPRRYVENNLSLANSAAVYSARYFNLRTADA